MKQKPQTIAGPDLQDQLHTDLTATETYPWPIHTLAYAERGEVRRVHRPHNESSEFF